MTSLLPDPLSFLTVLFHLWGFLLLSHPLDVALPRFGAFILFSAHVFCLPQDISLTSMALTNAWALMITNTASHSSPPLIPWRTRDSVFLTPSLLALLQTNAPCLPSILGGTAIYPVDRALNLGAVHLQGTVLVLTLASAP